MVLTTQLGALSGIRAFSGRGERPVVVAPDVHVLLVQEVDDPEGVDDIARLQQDLDRLVDGKVERRKLLLVDVSIGGGRCLHALGPDGVGAVLLFAVVLEVPRPLLADGDDRDVGILGLRLEDVLVTGREREESDDEDEGNDRVEDLDRHVVAQLHGEADLPLAAPVCDRRPAHQTPRDDAHREEHDPGVHPQPGHHVGAVRGRCAVLDETGEVAVQLRRGASREDDSRGDPDGKNCPAEAAFGGHGAPFRVAIVTSPV